LRTHRRIALEAKMPVRNSRNDAQYAPQIDVISRA
jgi:hypothetical protein